MYECTIDAQMKKLITNTFNLKRFHGKHFTPKGQVAGSNPAGVTNLPIVDKALAACLLCPVWPIPNNGPKMFATLMMCFAWVEIDSSANGNACMPWGLFLLISIKKKYPRQVWGLARIITRYNFLQLWTMKCRPQKSHKDT